MARHDGISQKRKKRMGGGGGHRLQLMFCPTKNETKGEGGVEEKRGNATWISAQGTRKKEGKGGGDLV